MIVREGKVAIRKIPASQKYISVNGSEYVFTMSANISMAWIDYADVPAVLAIRKTCCGGSRRPMFYYADENHLRRWENGGGR